MALSKVGRSLWAVAKGACTLWRPRNETTSRRIDTEGSPFGHSISSSLANTVGLL